MSSCIALTNMTDTLAQSSHQDVDPAAQTPTQEVVKLTNSVKLQPGVQIELVCQSGVRVEILDGHTCGRCNKYGRAVPSLFVSALTPVIFTAASTPMRISSIAPLDKDFARGWSKLPDELKVEVLKANLVPDEKISCRRCGRITTATISVLHHHLALGPDIAELALQVFYQCNTIALDVAGAILPPMTVRSHIRKLNLVIRCPHGTYWLGLQRLADPRSGFTGLQYINIEVEQLDLEFDDFFDFGHWHDEDKDIPKIPIRFKCKGQVSFCDKYDEGDDIYESSARKFEKLARGLIIFEG